MDRQTREEIREAVADGRISMEDAAAMWAREDPHHGTVTGAAEAMRDLDEAAFQYESGSAAGMFDDDTDGM